MNRQDVKAPTEVLIEIATWLADNFTRPRLASGPYLQFYRSDFKRDAISGKLSGDGAWCHLEAIDEARCSWPQGSLDRATFQVMVLDLGKRDRKLMKLLWVKKRGRMWNRGTLKSVLAMVHTKLSRGRNARGAKTDPRLIARALEMIGEIAVRDDARFEGRKALPERSKSSRDRPVTDPQKDSDRQSNVSNRVPEDQLLTPLLRARVPSSSSSPLLPTGEERGRALPGGIPPSGSLSPVFSDRESQDFHGDRQGQDLVDHDGWEESHPAEAVHRRILELWHSWHAASSQSGATPRPPGLTRTLGRLVKAQLDDEKTVWTVLASLDGVSNNGFHTGCKPKGKITRPRFGVKDVLRLDDTIDAVEANLALCKSPDPHFNDMTGRAE